MFNLQNVSSNNSTLLLVVLVFIFAVLGLLALVLRQRRQINELETALKPKVGFLGKPLVSMAAMLLLVGGFGLTYYASQNVQNVPVSADKNLVIQIVRTTKSTEPTGYLLDLAVIPIVNDVAWGGSNLEKFDIFWTITGKEDLSYVNLNATRSNPGGITRIFSAGEYTLKVDILYADKAWTKTETFTVP